MPDRKTLTIIAVAVLIVLVGWFAYRSSKEPAPEGPPQTRTEAPADTVVPDAGAADIPENVAVPEVVISAAPQAESKFRSFKIRVEGDKFVPDTVAVNVGDTVHIDLTAVDKTYDFVQPDYGVSGALPAGATKVLEFQATTEGKYTLYCAGCGGPEEGPVGYIVVVRK